MQNKCGINELLRQYIIIKCMHYLDFLKTF